MPQRDTRETRSRRAVATVAIATAVVATFAILGPFTTACASDDGTRDAAASSDAVPTATIVRDETPATPKASTPLMSAPEPTAVAVDPRRLDLGVPVPAPGPVIVAPDDVDVLRGEPVRIRYRIRSAETATAHITIVVRSRDGTAVARVAPDAAQPYGRTLTCTLPHRLAPGEYRYEIFAVDGDGRHQQKVGSAPLVVRDVVPRPADILATVEWLSRRSGSVGFAVIDSEGVLRGWHQDQQFVTASVVKAMLLVAYLRSHPQGPGYASSTLRSMIGVSDNGAASAIHGIVGDAGMYSVARAAGMKRFVACGYWSGAQITAADQARFFSRIFDLVPRRQRAYARGLLSHIASYQSWGVPAAARHHGWKVYFKGGWRGTDRGQLVHQVARLEKNGQVVTIAVLTDGDPSMAYGIETIRGATERVLGLH